MKPLLIWNGIKQSYCGRLSTARRLCISWIAGSTSRHRGLAGVPPSKVWIRRREQVVRPEKSGTSYACAEDAEILVSLHGGMLGSLLSTLLGRSVSIFPPNGDSGILQFSSWLLGRQMLQALIPRTQEEALQDAPGRPVIMLRPAPVRVRSIIGNAIAYTVTHVLVEWDAEEKHHLRWEANWLVHRVQ